LKSAFFSESTIKGHGELPVVVVVVVVFRLVMRLLRYERLGAADGQTLRYLDATLSSPERGWRQTHGDGGQDEKN